jgi:hypothetical protein
MATRPTLLLLAACALLGGCTSFSTYQSPRTLAPGRTGVTFAFTNVTIHDPGADSQESLDIMVRRGITKKVDVGVKYALFAFDEGPAQHVLLADAKVALVPRRLSAAMPVGAVVTSGELDLWQAHPMLIFAQPLGDLAELDLAARGIFMASSEGDWELLAAGSLGLRLGPDDEGFAIHPEVSVLVWPGESGYAIAFGAAASFNR